MEILNSPFSLAVLTIVGSVILSWLATRGNAKKSEVVELRKEIGDLLSKIAIISKSLEECKASYALDTKRFDKDLSNAVSVYLAAQAQLMDEKIKNAEHLRDIENEKKNRRKTDL